MATHSGILVWRIPVDRGAWRATVHGVTESDMTEGLCTAQHHLTALNVGWVKPTAADSRAADYIYFVMCRHA